MLAYLGRRYVVRRPCDCLSLNKQVQFAQLGAHSSRDLDNNGERSECRYLHLCSLFLAAMYHMFCLGQRFLAPLRNGCPPLSKKGRRRIWDLHIQQDLHGDQLLERHGKNLNHL